MTARTTAAGASLRSVEVRSDRYYRFDAPVDAVWKTIGDVGAYRRWWPWLRAFEARALAAGERWQCTVQPPLPYVLRFCISLEEVSAPTAITATVSGDITGAATLHLAPFAGGGCEVHLESWLAPSNRVLRQVARLARPAVRFGHDWVLDTAARQFGERGL